MSCHCAEIQKTEQDEKCFECAPSFGIIYRVIPAQVIGFPTPPKEGL